MSQSAGGDEHVQMLLGVYVLDASSPSEKASVDKHLAQCQECREECAELRQVAALLTLLPEDEWAAMGLQQTISTGADGADLPTAGSSGPRKKLGEPL